MQVKEVNVTEESINAIRKKLDMESLTFALERENLEKHTPKEK